MAEIEFPKEYLGLDYYPGTEVRMAKNFGNTRVKVAIRADKNEPEGPRYIFMTIDKGEYGIDHFALHESGKGPISLSEGQAKTALRQVRLTLSGRKLKKPKVPSEAFALRERIHTSLERLIEEGEFRKKRFVSRR